MRSNHEDGVIQEEKSWLEQVSGKPVRASRQHYIYLRFPDTYRSLLQAGISDDYSMGYPDACGFRAGTARPFFWYDLEQETETGLQIHPFCAMDVTCRHYMKLSPEQAIEKGRELKNNLRNTGGMFGFIFHNESLGHAKHWTGWQRVFEAWLE